MDTNKKNIAYMKSVLRPRKASPSSSSVASPTASPSRYSLSSPFGSPSTGGASPNPMSSALQRASVDFQMPDDSDPHDIANAMLVPTTASFSMNPAYQGVQTAMVVGLGAQLAYVYEFLQDECGIPVSALETYSTELIQEGFVDKKTMRCLTKESLANMPNITKAHAMLILNGVERIIKSM
jgi:hypothetical protein